VNEGKSLWEVAARGALSSAYGRLAQKVHAWCEVELLQPPSPPWWNFLSRRGRRNGAD
jgi:hypothetical protein